MRPAEIRDHLETSFATEQVDASWARTAERTAESRIKNVLTQGTSLRSVECHSSMCRIETGHQNVDDFQSFVSQAFVKPESRMWNAPMFLTPLDEKAAEHGGPLVIVAYVAREGRELPRFEPKP
jgi:hypothetical protein